MDDKKPRRRWFQFSFKTLLIFVGAAAVLFWACWFGWPLWRNYREQMRFEQSVKQLRAGVSIDQVWQLHSWHKPDFAMHAGSGSPDDPSISMTRYFWPNAIYFIYYVRKPRPGGAPENDPSLSVEVFRLRPPTTTYIPRTERGRTVASGAPQGFGFMGDFLDFIAGDRAVHPDFEYELIHSDPITIGSPARR